MKMRFKPIICGVLLAVAALVLTSPVFADGGGEKKAFAIVDLYRIKTITDMALSPDGQKLLLSVRTPQLEKGANLSELFLVQIPGGQTRQLTFNQSSDSSPRWSEDGRYIFFLSGRRDGEQLWIMAADGGEARPVSRFAAGISSFKPARRQNAILFSSSVYPECMTDNECEKKLADKLENGPTQAHIADSLLYRHWDSYREWRYSHMFRLNPVNGEAEAITGGTIDYPAFFNLGSEDYDISPDGLTLCLTANHDPKPAHSTNTDLFLIDLRRAPFTPVNITASNKACDGGPIFSPDGKTIAYLRHQVPGYESDCSRLCIYDIASRESRVLTENLDNWVTLFRWSPDSGWIYFTVQEQGHTPLYRIRLKTGIVEPVIPNQTVEDFLVSPDGQTVIYRRVAIGAPGEIWTAPASGKHAGQRLTHLNREVEEAVDIRPGEPMWVEGAGGKKIHVFIIKPHGFDPAKKYPLIVNIHGGPQSQWLDNFRGDWQVYPGAGYVVALPNPHGSNGYGQEFCRAISGDYTGKVMEDIDKVTQHLASLPYVDKERIGAMGWSWGGYAIMWLEGHNKHYKALASMMGIYNPRTMYSGTEELWFPRFDFGGKPWDIPETYAKIDPSAHVKNYRTPCLVITGERDYRVPYTNSLEFFTDLQEMGVESRLIVFKNDGHWPSSVKSMPVYYNAHLEWFHKHLGGEPAPWKTEELIQNRAFDEKKPQTAGNAGKHE